MNFIDVVILKKVEEMMFNLSISEQLSFRMFDLFVSK